MITDFWSLKFINGQYIKSIMNKERTAGPCRCCCRYLNVVSGRQPLHDGDFFFLPTFLPENMKVSLGWFILLPERQKFLLPLREETEREGIRWARLR